MADWWSVESSLLKQYSFSFYIVVPFTLFCFILWNAYRVLKTNSVTEKAACLFEKWGKKPHNLWTYWSCSLTMIESVYPAEGLCLLKCRLQHLRRQMNLLWGDKLYFSAHYFLPPAKKQCWIYWWTHLVFWFCIWCYSVRCPKVVTSCIKDPCRVKMERQGLAIFFVSGLEMNII